MKKLFLILFPLLFSFTAFSENKTKPPSAVIDHKVTKYSTEYHPNVETLKTASDEASKNILKHFQNMKVKAYLTLVEVDYSPYEKAKESRKKEDTITAVTGILSLSYLPKRGLRSSCAQPEEMSIFISGQKKKNLYVLYSTSTRVLRDTFKTIGNLQISLALEEDKNNNLNGYLDLLSSHQLDLPPEASRNKVKFIRN